MFRNMIGSSSLFKVAKIIPGVIWWLSPINTSYRYYINVVEYELLDTSLWRCKLHAELFFYILLHPTKRMIFTFCQIHDVVLLNKFYSLKLLEKMSIFDFTSTDLLLLITKSMLCNLSSSLKFLRCLPYFLSNLY